MFYEWLYKPPPPREIASDDDDDEIEDGEEGESKNDNALMSLDGSIQIKSVASNSTSKNTMQSHMKPFTNGEPVIKDQQLKLFEGNNLNLQIALSDNPEDDAGQGFFSRLQIKRTNKKVQDDKDNKFKVPKKKKKSRKKSIDRGDNESKSVHSALSVVSNTTVDTCQYYIEDNAMKLREQLRMEFCARHHTSLIMAAIRYDELPLMEFITHHVKESEDIDKENIYGDTPLTLACRLGKLDFVKQLLQHGADINKESFNGRTGTVNFLQFV